MHIETTKIDKVELMNEIRENFAIFEDKIRSSYPSATKAIHKIRLEIDRGNWPDEDWYNKIVKLVINDYLDADTEYIPVNPGLNQRTFNQCKTFFQYIHNSTSETRSEEQNYLKMLPDFERKFQKKIAYTNSKFNRFIAEYKTYSKETALTLLMDLLRGLSEGLISLVKDVSKQLIYDRRQDLSKKVAEISQNLIQVYHSMNIIWRNEFRYTADITFVRNSIAHEDLEMHDGYCIFADEEFNPQIKIKLTLEEIVDWVYFSVKKAVFFRTMVNIEILSFETYCLKHKCSN